MIRLHSPERLMTVILLLDLEAREQFVKSLALLKRNALAAPFERAFKSQKELEGGNGNTNGELMQIHYRDEEAIYIQAASDRVTVFFSTVFREETDRIYGKLFLQVRSEQALFNTEDQMNYYETRNSLMHGDQQRCNTLLKCCTAAEILRSNCEVYPD